MQVQIFSIILSLNCVKWYLQQLEADVNKCLKEHPKAKVEWLQTSAAGGGTTYLSFTTLTAIVSYEE